MNQPHLMLADGATLLVLTGMAQLVVGNAIIGLLEGILLAAIFKVPRKRAVWIMILANYVSMIAGLVGVKVAWAGLRPWLVGDEPLYHMTRLVLIPAALSFAVTLALEWPFCYWAMKGETRRFRRSVQGDLIVQTASYLLLVPVFFWASQINLLTDFSTDRSLAARSPNDATVFFVDGRDDALYRIGADGSDRRKVADLPADWMPKLVPDQDFKWWDLQIEQRGQQRTLIPHLASDLFSREDAELAGASVDPWHYGPAYDYRRPGERRWLLSHDHWSWISASDSQTDRHVSIAMELPFEKWMASAVTMLPGERAVFAMGDQILLADMNTRKVCMLVRGHWPIVVPNRCLVSDAATKPK